MPRNRSEKLPSCPEAIAYADAVEKWSLEGAGPGVNLGWSDIPFRERKMISIGTDEAFSARNLRAGRRIRAAYIRKHYAA